MKNNLLLIILLFSVSLSGKAQQSTITDSLAIKALGKLQWLEGNWSGEGWVDSRDARHFFNQTESIRTKVKGTVMLIEGLGIDKANAEIKHEAFAVVSYDIFARKYLMRAFKSDGKYVDAKINVEDDGTLVWGFKIDDAPEVRYTIKKVNEKWVEIGEFNLGAGKWTKFYEMTLNKQE
ncbi:MAG: hypothetical protein EYC69_11135 [Bacteroidetes bacterium]|nr:MAG: hypothetical protein EYC69_11135 [Bacteroidota bacterium]